MPVWLRLSVWLRLLVRLLVRLRHRLLPPVLLHRLRLPILGRLRCLWRLAVLRNRLSVWLCLRGLRHWRLRLPV